MVKKLFYFLLAITLLIAIYLTIFEFLLSNFHSPFNSEIKEPTAHNATWIYLLKQHYITFIEIDLFNIHEKRHLLDVKRVLDRTYSIWITLLSLTLLILIISFIKNWIKKLLQYVVVIGTTINIFLTLLSLNFLNSFNLFHSLFFAQNSWSFPNNSILIECFPLLYFQEFFLFFLILSFLIFILLNFYVKITNENFNNR